MKHRIFESVTIHGGAVADTVLLGYHVWPLCNWFQTFRSKTVPPSSRVYIKCLLLYTFTPCTRSVLPVFRKLRIPLSCSHKGASYIQFTSSRTFYLRLIAGFTSHTRPGQLWRLLFTKCAFAAGKCHYFSCSHSYILPLQLGGSFFRLPHLIAFIFSTFFARKKGHHKTVGLYQSLQL